VSKFDVAPIISIISVQHVLIMILSVFIADTFARGICGIGNDVIVGL